MRSFDPYFSPLEFFFDCNFLMIFNSANPALGDLYVAPNSTLSFVAGGASSGTVTVSGCLSINGSRLELQLQQEPSAGGYNVASTDCLVGKASAVEVTKFYLL